MVKQFRAQIERLSQLELSKAKRRLLRGESPSQVLDDFSRLLLNKIMHKPSLALKQAAYDGHASMLLLLKSMLDVES